ncbi:MAG: hypothetical protein GEU87_10180 [Alphaproteobacteria bacterium]|nr:hypothetical protein [Alphaproteobacteria bacterium]
MWASDLADAKAVLEKHGFTQERALAFVEADSPGTITFRTETPSALKDPAHEACHAVRLLLLDKYIEGADPLALQIGRLWARANLGLEFPQIAKAMQAWWISKHSGPGGRRKNDLTRTLQSIIQEIPTADWKRAVDYLQTDEASDRYHSTQDPTIHVTAVELDDTNGVVTYQDRAGTTHTVKASSLERKLRGLRRG